MCDIFDIFDRFDIVDRFDTVDRYIDNIEYIDDIKTSDDMKIFIEYMENIENVSNLSNPSIIPRSWICMGNTCGHKSVSLLVIVTLLVCVTKPFTDHGFQHHARTW